MREERPASSGGAPPERLQMAYAVLWAASPLNAAYFLPILRRAWFRPLPSTWPEEHFARRGWRELALLLLPPLFTSAATLAAGMLADSEMSPLTWAKLIAEREYIEQAAMTLKEAFLWQPSGFVRGVILIAGTLLVTAISYTHTATGLAYEFHAFYIVPVLAVGWFLGARYGYALSILASAEWFLADRVLSGDQSALSPLVFNTAVRLTIFMGGAWLVGGIRLALLRESRLAREDGLTHLPNRREFHERGRLAFAQAQRQEEPFTAVFIDLDRFKEVNDARGHGVGDQLLKSVAAAMPDHIRISDVPGRLGGDEFALLLPGMKAAAAKIYVGQLQSHLLDAMKLNGWPVTFSIGVASYRVTPEDFDGLLKQADAVMYEVKHGGRNRILLHEF